MPPDPPTAARAIPRTTVASHTRARQNGSRGTLFEQFHTLGAECSPSRASWFTGRSPSDKAVRIHLVIGSHADNVGKGCGDYLNTTTPTIPVSVANLNAHRYIVSRTCSKTGWGMPPPYLPSLLPSIELAAQVGAWRYLPFLSFMLTVLNVDDVKPKHRTRTRTRSRTFKTVMKSAGYRTAHFGKASER